MNEYCPPPFIPTLVPSLHASTFVRFAYLQLLSPRENSKRSLDYQNTISTEPTAQFAIPGGVSPGLGLIIPLSVGEVQSR